MKYFKILFAVIVASLFISCQPSLKSTVLHLYPEQPWYNEIVVVYDKSEIPKGAVLSSTIKIGDSGTATKCQKSDVLALAYKQANTLGANMMLITKLAPSTSNTKCYNLEAELYYFSSAPDPSNPILFHDLKSEKPKTFARKTNREFFKRTNYPGPWQVKVNYGLTTFDKKGFSYSAEIFERYSENLRKGNYFGAGAMYFINKNVGFGFLYNHLNTSATASPVYYQTDQGWIRGTLHEEIDIHFMGPQFGVQTELISSAVMFNANAAFGKYAFREAFLTLKEGTSKADSFGLLFSFGVQIQLYKIAYLNLEVNKSFNKYQDFQVDYDGESILYQDENKYDSMQMGIGLSIRL